MNIDRIYKDNFPPEKRKLRIIPKKSKSSAPQQNLMDEVNKHIQQIPVNDDKLENTDIKLIENYEKQLHDNLSKCLEESLGNESQDG